MRSGASSRFSDDDNDDDDDDDNEEASSVDMTSRSSLALAMETIDVSSLGRGRLREPASASDAHTSPHSNINADDAVFDEGGGSGDGNEVREEGEVG